MTWVRLDDNFPDHPQVVAAGPEAAYLWICCIAYCNRVLSDGHVPAEQMVKLATFERRKRSRLVSKLEQVGLLSRFDSGWVVVNYLRWNPSRSEVKRLQELTRVRQAKRRNIWKEADNDFPVTRDKVGTEHALVTRESRVSGAALVTLPSPLLSDPSSLPTVEKRESVATAPPPSPEPVRAPPRRKATTPLPEDFAPSDEARALATAEGVDVDRELAKMRDWAIGKDERKASWEAAFRGWLRRAGEDARKRGHVGVPKQGYDREAPWIKAAR